VRQAIKRVLSLRPNKSGHRAVCEEKQRDVEHKCNIFKRRVQYS